MIKLRTDALAIAVVATALFGTAGCTNPNSTATGEGTAERAGKAMDAGAETVKEGAQEAGQTVAQGAENAGEAVSGAAQNAGEAVGGAVENAGEAVKGAAENATEATKGAAATVVLTPKVKNALVTSKQIDASTIDVDTDDDTKTVVLKGTLPTAEKKNLATQIAKKALVDAKSDYTVKNSITVGK